MQEMLKRRGLDTLSMKGQGRNKSYSRYGVGMGKAKRIRKECVHLVIIFSKEKFVVGGLAL